MSRRSKMWMTTVLGGAWVPTPKFNADMSRVGYSSETVMLNGGHRVNKSTAAAKVYVLAWNLNSREALQPVTDFSEGLYGIDPLTDKPHTVYFVDPMAADRNVFNQQWAAPMTAAADAMPLIQDHVPDLIRTTPNAYGYPIQTAMYRTDGRSEKFFIPCPPGWVVWLGAHGTAGIGTGVQWAPVTSSGTGAPTSLEMMGLTADQVNTPISGQSLLGVEVSLISTGEKRNLSTNPSFEVNITGSGVAVGPGGLAGVGNSTTTAAVGTRVLRGTWTRSATAPGSGLWQEVDVEPGKIYSFSGLLRPTVASRYALSVTWLNASGAVLGRTSTGTEYQIAGNLPWATLPRLTRRNVLAPQGAVTARLNFETVGGTGFVPTPVGAQISLDAVMANEGETALDYHDGNSDNWYWLGTPGASASAEKVARLSLTAMVAMILPAGVEPRRGAFASGQGNGGCTFRGEPTVTAYSAKMDKYGSSVGMTATLVETKPWE